ncbi:SDR family NAD(P)-dependent oxidoreductase [Mycobacterium branderi]|uniref:Short-chain dehydrogenase n=1 Tax=Mycobacterium branderi TaxID=43348 RepID=A0A7I7W3D9_9MYCO|nr:SDR family NAD(P)-dependent oxidoreductase [Mycobacterium branderi]MCV7235442.1 SDR family NAD(P)-dependent oxidoreductase [Mycobacterium branderi]ORA34380.1 hypothetical protein BST20_20385 [Mycobacterium branderi]BBZ11201.1 hypothetical protein MBRA_13960 [Mycobacterium branderi]
MTEFRAVVVTEAASSVALATAARLARRGDLVLMGARRVDICERLATRLRASGAAAFAAHLDLADTSSIDRFVESARYLLGEVDVVVTGAGAADGSWVGAQHLAAQLVPPMIDAGHGDVILISPELFGPPPRGSRRELDTWMSALDAEFIGTGVRASLIRSAPGNSRAVPDDVGRLVAAMVDACGRMHLRHVEIVPPMAAPTLSRERDVR